MKPSLFLSHGTHWALCVLSRTCKVLLTLRVPSCGIPEHAQLLVQTVYLTAPAVALWIYQFGARAVRGSAGSPLLSTLGGLTLPFPVNPSGGPKDSSWPGQDQPRALLKSGPCLFNPPSCCLLSFPGLALHCCLQLCPLSFPAISLAIAYLTLSCCLLGREPKPMYTIPFPRSVVHPTV